MWKDVGLSGKKSPRTMKACCDGEDAGTEMEESQACCLCCLSSDNAERLWDSGMPRDGGFCPRQPWGPLLRERASY